METTVFLTVLTVRFVLPFAILRYPLPGVLACLVVDGMDQTVFQWFGFDPPFYQGYDKAMDVFYLGVAYISTMRNWVNLHAFTVSRFLFFYRQIGVVAFELTQVRALLLVFPNTFEYFFIAYEGIRSRWNTIRFQLKFWLLLAAFIWIVIKLPQEYWIHIAQLDFTDTVKDVPWFCPGDHRGDSGWRRDCVVRRASAARPGRPRMADHRPAIARGDGHRQRAVRVHGRVRQGVVRGIA